MENNLFVYSDIEWLDDCVLNYSGVILKEKIGNLDIGTKINNVIMDYLNEIIEFYINEEEKYQFNLGYKIF